MIDLWSYLKPLQLPERLATRRDVQIWLVDYLEAGHGRLYESCLSNGERHYLKTCKDSHRQKQFLLGRAALRHVLSHSLDVHPEKIRITLGEFGRPELDPQQDDLSFNLSHSAEFSVIALSKTDRVGIDMELIKDDIDSLDVGRSVLSGREMDLLRQSDGDVDLFFRLWTAKEAVLKWLGSGFSKDPKSISLHSLFRNQGDLAEPLSGNLLVEQQDVWLYEIPVARPLKIALAV